MVYFMGLMIMLAFFIINEDKLKTHKKRENWLIEILVILISMKFNLIKDKIKLI